MTYSKLNTVFHHKPVKPWAVEKVQVLEWNNFQRALACKEWKAIKSSDYQLATHYVVIRP